MSDIITSTAESGNSFLNFRNILTGLGALYLLAFWKRIYIIIRTLPRDLNLVTRGIPFLLTGMISAYKKETILTRFAEQVKQHPDRKIIYFQDKVWTIRDLDAFSNKIGRSFQKLGYKKGDVVSLISYNSIEYVGIWLGLAKVGVITALINTNLRLQPLAHCIKAAKSKGVIFTGDFNAIVADIKDQLPSDTDYLEFAENGNTEHVDLASMLSAASDDPVEPDSPIVLADKIMYIYTSGTTGLPKAAIISHKRSAIIIGGLKFLMGLRSDDIIYNPLPLYHSAGGLIGVLPAITHGIAVTIRLKFSASSYFPDCIKYKCTIGQYIGELCRYVLSTPPSPADTQHQLRLMMGNGLRSEVWKPFVERFKIPHIIELYGSTEGNANIANFDNTIGAVGSFPTFIPLSWLPLQLIKYDEVVGEPVRDKNGFCIRCKFGEPGMCVGHISTIDPSRSFEGYVDTKETNKKILKNVFKEGDAYFLSGDILVMDEYRYLYFRDRTGDTFRWKGENVSTSEVEAVISSLINYKECTAYGVEVGNLEGRAGMIAVVDPEEEIDLKALTKGIDRSLPSYSRPLFLRVLSKLPYTGTFKVIKTDLKREGFNPDLVKDKLYFKDQSEGYIPITKETYQEIINQKRKI